MEPFNILDADPAAVFSFARKQSHVLNAQIYEIEYPEMDYAALVPVNTNYPEWASGADTLVGDIVGKAEWQSGYAKDIPLADTKLGIQSVNFDMYAVGYQWNVEELGKAAFVNFPLTGRRAEAARRASEEFIWNNVLTGSTVKRWTGLLNSQYVTPVAVQADGTAAPNTAWVLNDGTGNKTPEQIVRDVNYLIMGPLSAPNTPLASTLADTVLLPPLAYRYIASTPYGVTSPNMTILRYIRENNEYTARTGNPLMIREVNELATAATEGVAGGGRAIGYQNREQVLELPMPMPFRFLSVYQDGPLNYVVPGISRVGPVDVKRPLAMRYGDGVTPVPPAP
ncbi:major capsid family protein [Nitratireductor sp. GCM10026969]|uniref:major capsid family protein n=1 Tax=Nitratireductor sp. GCM10026969 TaxID=3252645 RepID=UPI00361534C3